MTTKEFEKQTLDQLLIDLKDIDNYKSFRKGAFVYDLGHYQGLLLVNEIERLNRTNNEIFKANEILAEEIKKLQNQLQQKENIIKEGREYIESYMPNYDFDKTNLRKLLEILDKGGIK